MYPVPGTGSKESRSKLWGGFLILYSPEERKKSARIGASCSGWSFHDLSFRARAEDYRAYPIENQSGGFTPLQTSWRTTFAPCFASSFQAFFIFLEKRSFCFCGILVPSKVKHSYLLPVLHIFDSPPYFFPYLLFFHHDHSFHFRQASCHDVFWVCPLSRKQTRSTQRQKFAGLDKIAGLQSIEVHAACKTRTIKLDLVTPGRFPLVHQNCHLSAEQVVHS